LTATFSPSLDASSRCAATTFGASLGYGSLASRPRSPAEWDLRRREVDHRWSDDRWDWAVRLDQERLTDEGLEALKRQLGS
jgi:hypothetical protein